MAWKGEKYQMSENILENSNEGPLKLTEIYYQWLSQEKIGGIKMDLEI